MSLHGSQTALNRRSVSDRQYTFRSSGDYSTRSDGAGDVFTSPIHLQYGAGGGDLHLSGQHPYGLGSGIGGGGGGGGGELLGTTTTTRMTYSSKNPRISESRSYNMVETAPYSSKMDSLKRQHNWIQAMTDECANNLNRAEILLQETDFNI